MAKSRKVREHEASAKSKPRKFPAPILTPSRIALGTWAIGGWMWGGSDDALSIRTIQSAVDRGVTLIDTAPVYGFGHSEEIVGRALKEGGRRNKVAIATKVALDWKDGKPFRNASRGRIMKEIDDSLRRLQTDVIDLYQVHWPDPNVPIEETAGALKDLLKAGKIRAIGVSNFSPGADGQVPRRGAARHQPAAVQSVRARDRARRAAL